MMTFESEERSVKSLNSRLRSKNGAALIMALLILSAFSLLTAAIVLTVQTEIKISANYKYGEEAFYVANAGVQKSLDWFNTVYAPHLPTSDYDTAKVPVQYQSNNAVLAGQPGSTCNYPDSATFTPFAGQFASATLQADGKNSGQYAVNATLIRTKAVRFLDTATMTTSASAIERWRIDSIGFWGTATNPIGRSEVSAVIEKQGSAFWNKALWSLTSATLGSGTRVDSYDPLRGPYGGSNIGNNGDLGSNGNVDLGNNNTVSGDIQYGPTGTFTESSTASVTGTVSQLTAARVFPPIPGFSVGTIDFKVNDGLSHSLAAGSYGNVQASKSGTNITLTGGTYYLDQLQLSGNATITLSSGTNTTLYVKSQLDLSGGAVLNPDRDPTTFQIYYTGTSDARLTGSGDFYGTVYAPNAEVRLQGQNTNLYGSFIGNRITVSGGASVHYDDGLLREFLTPLPFRIITWTQKAF